MRFFLIFTKDLTPSFGEVILPFLITLMFFPFDLEKEGRMVVYIMLWDAIFVGIS